LSGKNAQVGQWNVFKTERLKKPAGKGMYQKKCDVSTVPEGERAGLGEKNKSREGLVSCSGRRLTQREGRG